MKEFMETIEKHQTAALIVILAILYISGAIGNLADLIAARNKRKDHKQQNP